MAQKAVLRRQQQRGSLRVPISRREAGSGKEVGSGAEELADEKAESYDLHVKLSCKEREEFEKDHAGFMKKYLEARGHKVNEYVVTPKSAKALQTIIENSKNDAVLEFSGGVKHVPKCTWI